MLTSFAARAGDFCWINPHSKNKKVFSIRHPFFLSKLWWWVVTLSAFDPVFPNYPRSNFFLTWSFIPAEISPWSHSVTRGLERPRSQLPARRMVSHRRGFWWALAACGLFPGPAGGLCWPWVGWGLSWPPVFSAVKKWLPVLWWLPHSLLPHLRARMGAACGEGTFFFFFSPPPSETRILVLTCLPCSAGAGLAPLQCLAVWAHGWRCHGHDWILVKTWLFLGDQLLPQSFQQNCAHVWEPCGSTWHQNSLPLNNVPHLGTLWSGWSPGRWWAVRAGF